MMPADPKLVEAIFLACLERNPVEFQNIDEREAKRVQVAIKRATTPKGTRLRETLNWMKNVPIESTNAW